MFVGFNINILSFSKQKEPLFTSDISSYKPNNCNCKLYAEAYHTWNGLTEDYLTDSTSFRMYSASYDDENEMINYHCKGDSVYVVKKQSTGIKYYNLEGKLSIQYRVINTKVFSLKI